MSFLCKWFGIGCPEPTPVPPTPPALRAVSVVALGPSGPIMGASVVLDDHPQHKGTTNGDGYVLFPEVPVSLSSSHVWITAEGYLDFAQHVDLPSGNVNLPFTLEAAVKPLPAPPTRDALLGAKLTFQGLVVETKQFGKLPWFEAALAWLSPEDRASVYAAKHAAGDTHCIVFLPGGPPLYDEPNQPYSADRFGPLDWTAGDTKLDPQFDALLREVIGQGFKVLLFLDGDSPENYGRGMAQLDLLKADVDFATTLYKYCVIVPGWDGVFYGWTPEQIIDWGLKGRRLFPDGYLGLEYSTGHIPVGEGGEDYKPRQPFQTPYDNPGRMTDFDLIIGEFDNNLHADTCWQILNRMEANYVRPPDQPADDDPNRVFYLGTPNPRGPFYHFAFEYGEYEFVRGGCSQASIDYVNANRAYLKSMGARFVG